MAGLELTHPEYLWGLAAAPVMLALALWAVRRRRVIVGSLYLWNLARAQKREPARKWRWLLTPVVAFLIPVFLSLALCDLRLLRPESAPLAVVAAPFTSMRGVGAAAVENALREIAAVGTAQPLCFLGGEDGRRFPDVAGFAAEILRQVTAQTEPGGETEARVSLARARARVGALLQAGQRVVWLATVPSGWSSPHLREWILPVAEEYRVRLRGVWATEGGVWAGVTNASGRALPVRLCVSGEPEGKNSEQEFCWNISPVEARAFALPQTAHPVPGRHYRLFCDTAMGKGVSAGALTVPVPLRCAVDDRIYPEIALFLRAAAGATIVPPDQPADLAVAGTLPVTLPRLGVLLVDTAGQKQGAAGTEMPLPALHVGLTALGKERLPERALEGLVPARRGGAFFPPQAQPLILTRMGQERWPFLAQGYVSRTSRTIHPVESGEFTLRCFWLASPPEQWVLHAGFALTLAWMLREFSGAPVSFDCLAATDNDSTDVVQSSLTFAYKRVSSYVPVGYFVLLLAVFGVAIIVGQEVKNLLHKPAE